MAKVEKQANVPAKETNDNKGMQFAFGKINYILMIAGLAVLLLGFILMIGGGSENPDVFNEEIFNFQRLTLAPILILAGFAIEIYAIMKKAKD
jgi:hypothetical protein